MSEGKALVPRLRFPEFREVGKWQQSTLEQLVVMRSGGTPSKANPEFWNGSIPWVSAKDMKQFFLEDTEDHISTAAVDEGAKLVPTGTLLMLTRGMTLLKDVPICVLRRKMSFNQDVKALRPKKDVDGLFLGLLLLGNKHRLLKMVDIAGHGTGRLNTDKLKGLELLLPQPAEQQRIANCLSSLDALIAAQADKIDALKTHKKGLMQQLFPREGETVPRLRFPEFREAGEWKFTKAKYLFSNRVEHGEDGLPIYSVTMNNGLAKRDSLDRKIDDISHSTGNKKVHKHDIAYNMMRMWQGASGVAIEDCMVSPAYVILAPSDGVCAEFYGYFLKLPQSLQVLTAHSQGLTKDRLRLYYKDFAQIPLPQPTLGEQQKIANCLSSLDALIATQADKLDALKTHKKGLMQQLFPGPEAVAA
ncbi:restriction endonuclease subunit S [Allochromatium humboldtianum]|uniref:Restriction endonuclease subunit S n=1 Tax=Allochromatium humboldtianum TaxID=504901 RepID=A0A850RM61_9GAMM|nr:restriction endonuclease subunit S [Allochromatium humboldtianum]NVZ10561.1 restriction endonuclease subunit S [Allochromatium humboldtianum]